MAEQCHRIVARHALGRTDRAASRERRVKLIVAGVGANGLSNIGWKTRRGGLVKCDTLQFSLVYENDTDEQLQGVSMRQMSVSRTWSEFVSTHF